MNCVLCKGLLEDKLANFIADMGTCMVIYGITYRVARKIKENQINLDRGTINKIGRAHV